MTIEQEFFEVFNLPIQYKYRMAKRDMTAIACNKETVIALVNAGLKVTEVIKNEITPEIVLKLEDILFRLNCNVHLERTLGTHENKSKPYKSNTGEIKYSKECHFEWYYEVFDLGDYFENEDKTYNDWRIFSQNVNRIEALLVIFINIIKNKNILLDKEIIQDQVRGLFNVN